MVSPMAGICLPSSSCPSKSTWSPPLSGRVDRLTIRIHGEGEWGLLIEFANKCVAPGSGLMFTPNGPFGSILNPRGLSRLINEEWWIERFSVFRRLTLEMEFWGEGGGVEQRTGTLRDCSSFSSSSSCCKSWIWTVGRILELNIQWAGLHY